MSIPSTGNIRVFVRWVDQTVFAGEDIKCRITFKNVAPNPNSPATTAGTGVASSAGLATPNRGCSTPTGERGQRHLSSLHASSNVRGKQHTPGLTHPPAATTRVGHRASISLNVPSNTTFNSPLRNGASSPWGQHAQTQERSSLRRARSHNRSISIVSATSNSGEERIAVTGSGSSTPSKRPNRLSLGHARSASLQSISKQSPGNPHQGVTPRHPYQQQNHSPGSNGQPVAKRASLGSVPSQGPSPPFRPPGARGLGIAVPEFRFPSAATPVDTKAPMSDVSNPPGGSAVANSAKSAREDSVTMPSTLHEHAMTPANRILAAQSIAGTPRSSVELYAPSNHSNETLASEYPPSQHQVSRGVTGLTVHAKRPSNLSPLSAQLRQPEMIMMAFARVQGSFTLDGSLIQQGQFEAVKRKAVVGGHGGGVVGVETPTKNSGLLRGFGWGSLLNDLVGNSELSTIKEMRGAASTKSIPLLSTPQSILFVDAKLGPGESKAFDYSFRLPKGLPPSHRGKAMKITYSLVIGTQRPGGARGQHVRTVEVPFRVLGSVNSHGEILGHDLMNPYVLLRDQAMVKSIEKQAHLQQGRRDSLTTAATKVATAASGAQLPATLEDFLSYVNKLLHQSKEEPGAGLLSPTDSSVNLRRLSVVDATPVTAKEAIDMAIMRSNITHGQQSQNRFEIARNGQQVAVVMLTRPAYRLGEAITMVVDFSHADIPCYAVHAALETTEKVDHSIAVRSEASIQRVTRKVFALDSQTTLYARRIVFTPSIPLNATPEFITSGVSLEWRVRLEFVVSANYAQNHNHNLESSQQHSPQQSRHQLPENPDDTNVSRRPSTSSIGPAIPPVESDEEDKGHHLLEQTSYSDRGGLVVMAAENLICESFEVSVPLRVYGSVCSGLEKLERDEPQEQGLVV